MKTSPSSYRILITGFGPYGNTKLNPSLAVVRLFQQHCIRREDGDKEEKKEEPSKEEDETHRDVEIFAGQVSSEFFKCIDEVKEFIKELQPLNAILMMGEYPGRAMVTLERFATNYNDSTRYGIRDEAGYDPQGVPTIPNGPVAYMSTVPLRRIVRDLRQRGIPSDISGDAGTLMCNHLLYGILHHVQEQWKLWYPSYHAPLVGWIHLPMLPETAALDTNLGMPSMASELSHKAVLTITQSIVDGLEATKKEKKKSSCGTKLDTVTDIDEVIESRLLV